MFQYGWFLPQHNTSYKKSVACPENVFWEKEAPGQKLPTRRPDKQISLLSSEVFPGKGKGA